MLSMTKIDEAPLYVALSEENALAKLTQLSLRNLSHENWIIFGRPVHPPLYDTIFRAASDLGVRPRDLHHIMVPEEAYQLIAEKNGVALLTKTGALKIARDGVTIRPLVESQLILKTFLASRADNDSKLTSELVRAFGARCGLSKETHNSVFRFRRDFIIRSDVSPIEYLNVDRTRRFASRTGDNASRNRLKVDLATSHDMSTLLALMRMFQLCAHLSSARVR